MSILIVLFRLLFSLGIVVLWVSFFVRIFAPGTPETAFFFRWLQGTQPYLDHIVNVLIVPIQWILHFVLSLLPQENQSVFPITPASVVAQFGFGILLKVPTLSTTAFGQWLSNPNTLSIFPGVVDWRLLMAIIFWSWVEAFFLGFFNRTTQQLEKGFRRKRMQDLNNQMRASFSHQAPREAPQPHFDPGKTILMDQVIQNAPFDSTLPGGFANVDPLTQLLQKKVWMERLAQEIENTKMMGGCLAVFEADVDDLGIINELHSRAAGDAFLHEIGQLFSQISIPQGKALAARLEDGKLAGMLTQTTPDLAHRVAELLRAQITQIRLRHFPKVKGSASFGLYVACFAPMNGSFDLTAPDMLSKADALLYKAKRSGKDQVIFNVLP